MQPIGKIFHDSGETAEKKKVVQKQPEVIKNLPLVTTNLENGWY
jgi:hypothetical protein